MLGRLRFRPLGGFIFACTAAAMTIIVIAAPSGQATAPLKEYVASFEDQCVIAPGVLNIKRTFKTTIRFDGPESVSAGESINLTEVSTTQTLPPEVTETFGSLLGFSGHLQGHVTSLQLDGTGFEPPHSNIAKPGEFPSGLPFFTGLAPARSVTFAAPSMAVGETGRTYSYGPLKVTGAPGTNAVLTVNGAPGFEEELEGNPEGSAYKATGMGIVSEIEGYRENGEKEIGPLTLACTAPAGVVAAEIPIKTITCTRTTEAFERVTIEPGQGPSSGGTKVTIKGNNLREVSLVAFAGKLASGLEQVSNEEVRAVTPPGSGTVSVEVLHTPRNECATGESEGTFTYISPVERAEYKNWVLSGGLTPKRLGQAITLPAGSTFNGTGEVNTESGTGSVKGSVAIPPFTASFKLFGLLPASLGLTLTPTGPTEGSVAKSETVPGDETLKVPLSLNVGVTSFRLLGLTVPTSCAGAEPVSLSLVDNLTREELLTKGWSFAGSTTLPKFKCERGLLGGLFAQVLSGLLTGPEGAYALKVTPAGG